MVKTVIIALFFIFAASAAAQELDCEVTLTTQQLSSEDLENLSDFSQRVKQYLNQTRWTKDEFGTDRIKCTMNIFIQGSSGDKQYAAQVFIGSQRRVWDLKTKRPSEKNTAALRIFDDKWEFIYQRGDPLVRSDYRFDPLTSFIDFYANLIIGFDYDSYERSAGTPYLQKALDIYNMSRSARSAKGWEFPGQGSYTRTRFIDELMNPKFMDFRQAFYEYHAEGLDRLSTKPDTALARIGRAIEMIGNMKLRINQQSVLLKTFFDTKYLELCEVFQGSTTPDIFRKLGRIDPSHQQSYDECAKKRN